MASVARCFGDKCDQRREVCSIAYGVFGRLIIGWRLCRQMKNSFDDAIGAPGGYIANAMAHW